MNQVYGIQKANYVGMHLRNLRKASMPGQHPTWPQEWCLCQLVPLCRVDAANWKPSEFLTMASYRNAEFGNLGHRVLLPEIQSLEEGEASSS